LHIAKLIGRVCGAKRPIYSKSLEEQDKAKANALITERFYPTVLEYMLKNNAKLEQEVIVIETEGYDSND